MSDLELKEAGVGLLGPRRKITSAVGRHRARIQADDTNNSS